MMLDITVERGARANNPARFITKKRIVQRELVLPSPEQFEAFISEVEQAGAWCSHECADLVGFLAFGGFRKTEAANILWNDCDFDNGQIRVRITKTGKPRSVAEMEWWAAFKKAEQASGKPTLGRKSAGETPSPLKVHKKPWRNAPCPCGSGKKYKHCCGKG